MERSEREKPQTELEPSVLAWVECVDKRGLSGSMSADMSVAMVMVVGMMSKSYEAKGRGR